MENRYLLLLVFLLAWAPPVRAWELHGFVDARSGLRLQQDDHQRDAILNELRSQFDLSHMGETSIWQLRADLVADEAAQEHDLNLERGHGLLDLREANVLLTPHDLVDVKLGRQILTWGTGDMLFINDLFPKDWQSFFIGRDVDYLKAPSDAVLVSFYPRWANVDLVYVPRFDADRYISGERVSYWNPALGRRAGDADPLRVDQRGDWLSEDELHLRLSRTLEGYELALYGYRGYWKSPQGADETGRQVFPRLQVIGASGRGGFLGGLGNVELGYYHSLDDADGDDPLLPNSEYRVLLGYERELVRDLSCAVQYYLEWMADYAAYERSQPAGMAKRDEDRHVVTVRLTRQALNQNLQLSLFGYWSPSDRDGYLRPHVKYKATDAVSLYFGANLFFGDQTPTFFGQFERNSNLYAAVRYSY